MSDSNDTSSFDQKISGVCGELELETENFKFRFEKEDGCVPCLFAMKKDSIIQKKIFKWNSNRSMSESIRRSIATEISHNESRVKYFQERNEVLKQIETDLGLEDGS